MKALKTLGRWAMAAIRFTRELAHIVVVIAGIWLLMSIWIVATMPGKAEDNFIKSCRDAVDAFNEGRRK